MTLKEIVEKSSELGVYEQRCVSDEYVELVFYSKEIEDNKKVVKSMTRIIDVTSFNFIEQDAKIRVDCFPKSQPNGKNFGIFCINSFPFQCKIVYISMYFFILCF